jgi:hypothetical protein
VQQNTTIDLIFTPVRQIPILATTFKFFSWALIHDTIYIQDFVIALKSKQVIASWGIRNFIDISLQTKGRHCLRWFGSKPFVALLSNAKLDTLALGQWDVSFAALANDKHIVHAGGEGVTLGILNVNNVEGSRMSFPVDDGTNSPQVTTSGDHTQISC